MRHNMIYYYLRGEPGTKSIPHRLEDRTARGEGITMHIVSKVSTLPDDRLPFFAVNGYTPSQKRLLCPCL